MFSSSLTANAETYSRDCRQSHYYYHAVQVNVVITGWYRLSSKSDIDTYGYIYKDNFNPLNPFANVHSQDDNSCDDRQFALNIYLQAGTIYVLVVTTVSPNVTGAFSIHIVGPKSVILKCIVKTHSNCFIGGRCQFYEKNIGITLDDILRDEIQPNITLNNQSFLVKMSTALTMIMFVAGLINSILSFITFQSKDLRKVGCGMYLLASSITSLLTICMFIVKFWYVIITQMNASSISLSVLRGGCVSIEPILKLFLYLDGWFNACVAVERAVLVFKGISFDKKKSKQVARWIIIILPFCIMATIIHEPLYRKLFEYEQVKDEVESDNIERHVWCLTRYSPSIQTYNTTILFLHLLGPFIANLFSTLFIIFGAARQRSVAQNQQSYHEHLREQLSEHKQLVISPIILLILASPRLIISLLPGCVNASRNPWLYLMAYFISFIPSILIFIVFVLPSELFRKKFKESINRWRRRQIHQ